MADPIPRAEHPFEGNIFILINGGGFSTTGHFTSVLQYHNIGTFVGVETGGTYTCNDASKEIKLDNTRIYVLSPRGTFAAAVEGFPDNRGIIPDVIIEPKVEDLVIGKDTELEYVLNELINKS
jgi:C-terminal processing protease CtpA/Prc